MTNDALHGEAAGALRPGEVVFADEDAVRPDAALRFVGTVRSPWTLRAECPKNVREARERGQAAEVTIAPRYRDALSGLEVGADLLLLTWLDRARRDLALQMPRHADAPRGTFSLRSPVRPNPIGLHLMRLVDLDAAAGRLAIDAIDVLDGTPVLDIKPFLSTVDVPPLRPDAG